MTTVQGDTPYPAALQKLTRYQPSVGNLFGPNGPVEADVMQGAQVGDCYMMAGLAAIARTHPDWIEKAIQSNADATFTVTFPNHGNPVSITVDGDLPRIALPGLSHFNLYGGGTNENVLWPAIIEKAYAEWKGGYDQIGAGGYPAAALQELTGCPVKTLSVGATDDQLFVETVRAALVAGAPMTATTQHDPAHPVAGILPKHVYTVDGIETVNGTTYVSLRNPFAMYEPLGNGADDGFLRIPMSEFNAAFSGVAWVK